MRTREETDIELTPDEETELDTAIAEADLGGGVPAETVLRELRERHEDHARRG
jgi:hypothetical protein